MTYRRGPLALPLILDPLGPDGRDDPDQLPPLLLIRHMPRIIPRLQPARMGQSPDLQEMDAFLLVVVEFRVSDPGTGRGHLEVPTAEDLGVV